jgi:hypothetical protein
VESKGPVATASLREMERREGAGRELRTRRIGHGDVRRVSRGVGGRDTAPGRSSAAMASAGAQGRTHHPGTAGGGLGWLAGCNGGQGASTVHGSKQHVARAQAWGSHRILA